MAEARLPEREYIPALGYRALTPLYDAVVRCATRERRFKQALIRQARLRAGHRILDLATGTGTLAIWIKESGPAADVTGVDIDRAILARAARKATRAGADIRGSTTPARMRCPTLMRVSTGSCRVSFFTTSHGPTRSARPARCFAYCGPAGNCTSQTGEGRQMP